MRLNESVFGLKSLGYLAILAAALGVVADAQNIVGTWQAAQPSGESSRIVLKITVAGNGSLQGTITWIDRSASACPLLSAIYRASELNVAGCDVSFRGKPSADGKSMIGTWTRGDQSSPLIFALATPETLWAYSGPSTIPAMPATADPAFEVASVKPSSLDSNTSGSSGLIPSRLYQARDRTVADLIRFAYNVRQRQIDGGPSWMNTLKFDIVGEPDTPGLPSDDQLRLMLKKLLAERFGLKLHIEKRDFAVYALVVHKSPPKVTASDPSRDPGSHIRFILTGLPDGNTAFQFLTTTMPEFIDLLMNFIPDRQIVDETDLAGRFNFTVVLPPAAMGGNEIDKANAFLLGIEPLGFKLEPQKAPLSVLVIDQVDKPSPN